MHKRNRPIQVALTDEDISIVDQYISGVVFNVSRSEVGVVAIRFMLDSLRRGQWSLESLFQNYLKQPLSSLSLIDLAQYAQIAVLRDEAIRAGLSESNADQQALLLGYQHLKRYDWQVEAREEREQVSA